MITEHHNKPYPWKCKVYLKGGSYYNSEYHGPFVVSNNEGRLYLAALVTGKEGKLIQVAPERVKISAPVRFIYPEKGPPEDRGEQKF